MTFEQFESSNWLRIKRIDEHLAAGRLTEELTWAAARSGAGR